MIFCWIDNKVVTRRLRVFAPRENTPCEHTPTTEQVVGPAHVGLAGQLHAYEGAAPCFVSRHSAADGQPARRPPPWALRAAVVLRGEAADLDLHVWMKIMGETAEVSAGLLVATASPNPCKYVLPTTVDMRSPGALTKATAAVHGTPKPPASATAAPNASLESASDTVAGEKAESCATLSCCALFPIMEREALKLKAVVVTVAGVGVAATVAPPQSTGAEVPAGQHLS